MSVVVKGYECPISDDTTNPLTLGFRVRMDDEIFHRCGVYEDNIWKCEGFGEEGRGEERSVLNDNEVTFVLIFDPELTEEAVCGLTNDLSWVPTENVVGFH